MDVAGNDTGSMGGNVRETGNELDTTPARRGIRLRCGHTATARTPHTHTHTEEEKADGGHAKARKGKETESDTGAGEQR